LGEATSHRPLRGALVRYATETPVDPALGNLEVIERPGEWRFQHAHHPELIEAALGWLDRATEAG
jgi:hypothetical protein